MSVIQTWCSEFDRTEDDTRTTVARDSKRRGEKRIRDDRDGHLTLKPIVHEIRIQNQVIFLDPPIEHARQTWIRQLHEWLAVVCLQRRIQSSRYEIGLQMQAGTIAETTYTKLVSRITQIRTSS